MTISRILSTAPMLDYSDTHCRYFWRLFSAHAVLYTEMIHANAVLYGKRERCLAFDTLEHPVALQLGGNDPDSLAESARYAAKYGYDEVNLNIGCPSDRVQSGQFGACLMRKPKLVAACVAAIKEAVNLPVTIKTRIGVDHDDSYAFFCEFVEQVSAAGTSIFIIHARKAWLKGLSPKQNRDIPPLIYERAYQLKEDFPHLTVIINGGIKTIVDAKNHLEHVDGVMIGREICANPMLLGELEQALFQSHLPSRESILHQYLSYVEKQLVLGVPYRSLLKPLMGLCFAQSNAKHWRQTLAGATLALTPDKIWDVFKNSA